MAEFRDEKIIAIIKEAGAQFLAQESTRASLLTVTKVDLSTDGKRAIIYFTAFPTDKEETALLFAKRKRKDFQEFMREKTSLGRMPLFDFAIDEGEKNRQKIDSLSQKI
ncbi:MAG: ribosome-binding factor A [Candidatus Pacebacteria bacterium]|nr:ribosome-binding factor A [Candidatus Paceibacterota bacterium]